MLNLCLTKCKNSFYRPCIQFHRMTIICRLFLMWRLLLIPPHYLHAQPIPEQAMKQTKHLDVTEKCRTHGDQMCYRGLGVRPRSSDASCVPSSCGTSPLWASGAHSWRGHCSTPRSAGLRTEGALHAGRLLLVSLSPSSCDSCSLFALTVHRVPCPTRGKWWPNEHSCVGSHHLKSPFAGQPVAFCPLMTHYHFWMCAMSPLLTPIVHVKNVLPCPAKELWEVIVWWICRLDTDGAAFQESKWGLRQGSLYRASVLIMWKQFRFAENQTTSAVNVRCRTQKNALFPNKWLKPWKWISLLSFLRSICRKQF